VHVGDELGRMGPSLWSRGRGADPPTQFSTPDVAPAAGPGLGINNVEDTPGSAFVPYTQEWKVKGYILADLRLRVMYYRVKDNSR
jgi:hypothetical protein